MREEAALAHVELLREAADGKAFETFDGSDIHGAAEDGLAGTDSTGLAANDRFGGRMPRMKSLWHEGSVTQK